jgi:hypothetical protein
VTATYDTDVRVTSGGSALRESATIDGVRVARLAEAVSVRADAIAANSEKCTVAKTLDMAADVGFHRSGLIIIDVTQ